jgi:CubicO group peptidase (beta-lactamase class C family)
MSSYAKNSRLQQASGRWRPVLFLIPIFFATNLLFGQNSNAKQPEKTTHSIFVDQIETVLDTEIPKIQKEQNVPAVGIGLIENGKVKFIKVYGEHQKGSKAPINTIFNVASITKPVVGMAVLKLVNQGEWDLDEPLYHYWVDPDIKDDMRYKKITTRHCLSHSTGFKNWRRMTKSGKLEIDFEPGSKFQYSGEGMEYLKKALEYKFKKGLDELVESLIFKPFNMKDATLKWLPTTDDSRFAKWYNSKGVLYDEDYKITNVSAADDLIATVNDLSIFGIATMNHSFMNQKIYDEMIRPQVKIHNNANQGLSWTVVPGLSENNYALNHDGGDTGVATTIILLPNSKSGIIVLTNGDNGRIVCNSVVRQAISFGNEIIKKLYWGGQVPKVINLDKDLLSNYAGKYLTNQGTELSFSVHGNSLKISGEGIPNVEIYPKSDNEFFPTDFEVFFKFSKTTGGLKFELLSQEKMILSGLKK